MARRIGFLEKNNQPLDEAGRQKYYIRCRFEVRKPELRVTFSCSK